MKDYYRVLGVSRNASQEEIKRAYRALAMQWHPDRNNSPEAEQKLKDINEAYEMLTKRQPDMFDDIFRDFGFSFGGQPRFGTFFSQQNYELEVDFLTMILGGEIAINTSQGQQKVIIPRLSKNGQQVMVSRNRNSQTNIILRVKLPSNLTDKEEMILRELHKTREQK